MWATIHAGHLVLWRRRSAFERYYADCFFFNKQNDFLDSEDKEQSQSYMANFIPTLQVGCNLFEQWRQDCLYRNCHVSSIDVMKWWSMESSNYRHFTHRWALKMDRTSIKYEVLLHRNWFSFKMRSLNGRFWYPFASELTWLTMKSNSKLFF